MSECNRPICTTVSNRAFGLCGFWGGGLGLLPTDAIWRVTRPNEHLRIFVVRKKEKKIRAHSWPPGRGSYSRGIALKCWGVRLGRWQGPKWYSCEFCDAYLSSRALHWNELSSVLSKHLVAVIILWQTGVNISRHTFCNINKYTHTHIHRHKKQPYSCYLPGGLFSTQILSLLMNPSAQSQWKEPSSLMQASLSPGHAIARSLHSSTSVQASKE